jgi:hypothetical protein
LVEQLICNQQVGGSSPSASSKSKFAKGALPSNKVPNTEEFQSGQMGQTVNLLLYGFDGPNPSSSTKRKSAWLMKTMRILLCLPPLAKNESPGTERTVSGDS